MTRLNQLSLCLAAIAALTAPLFAQSHNCADRSSTAPTKVVELVQFRLSDGVSQEQFVNAVEPTLAFLCAQPGFIRRTLSVDSDGNWLDMVEWESHEQATAASQKAMAAPQLVPFMQSLDPNTMIFSYAAPVLMMN